MAEAPNSTSPTRPQTFFEITDKKAFYDIEAHQRTTYLQHNFFGFYRFHLSL